MPNPLQQIKDRRKPWQKQLKNMKLARCGCMLAESAAEFGHANARAARGLNAVSYSYGYTRRPSIREVQYFLHMTKGDAPHHANQSNGGYLAQEAQEWLTAREANNHA